MKKLNLIKRLWTDSHEKQSPQRFARYAAILIMLLTLGVGQMWAGNAGYVGNEESYFKNYLEYSKNGGSATQFQVAGSGQSDLALGTVTGLSLTQYGVGMYQDADNLNGKTSDKFCYWIHEASSSSESWTEVDGNWEDWNTHGWSGGWRHPGFGNNNLEIDVLDGLDPGNYKLTFYFKHQGNSNWGNAWLYLSNGGDNYNITFTVPGFTTTSTSQTFDNTTVSSNSSKTISFTQHYGTALTTNNCALSGTNSSEFEVTDISETGVTVKFKPSTAGSKSATLTITDAHSETCTITLNGKTQSTVSYNKGSNGTGSNTTANKVYGTNLTLLGATFTRTGYTQTAWNTNSAGTGGTSYSLSGTYSTEAAVTLYPTWTANTYSITLDDDGDYGGNGSATATYDGTALSVSSHASRDGWNLVGYFAAGTGDQVTDADGNLLPSKSFSDGSSHAITNSSSQWIYDGDLTLYAHWSQSYSVTYNANGGSGTMTDGSSPYEAGSDVTVLDNDFTRSGYTFTGWNTANDGSGDPYDEGDEISDIAANVTLYAQWSENNYTVTVNAGSHGSVATTSVTGHKDTKVTLPTATANTGYHFDTWTTTSGSVTYTNQTSATTAQVNGLTAAAAVRADFAANTYSVVFNANGGTGSMSNESFTYDAAAKALTSNAYSKSGYTFVGWATTADRANAMNIDYTNGQSVQNLTSTNGGTFNLYAVWAKKYYIGGRFQHDWTEGDATDNEMTYDRTSGYYKYETSKTVNELSVQWYNSSSYYADQYFYIHTGKGKGATSSLPTYVGASSNGHNMEEKIGYSNAYVLTAKTSSFDSFAEADLLKFTNIDNLSSDVIVWWDPANKKIWYTATESLNTNYYLLGFGTGSSYWSESDARRFKVASVNATTASVTVSLTAKTYTYNTDDGFKVKNGTTYYGNNGTMTRASCSGWDFETDKNNCGITADVAGTYTFTLNLSTKAVSVDYPAETMYDVTIEAQTGGTVSYDGGDAGSSCTASAGASTASADIVATANTGYYFAGWQLPDGTITKATEGDYDGVTQTITINATADSKTVTALFNVRYALLGSTDANDAVTAGMPGWGESNEAPFAYSDGTYTKTVTLTKPNVNYKFRIVDRRGASHTNYGLSSKAVIAADGNYHDLASTSADAQLATAGVGTYTIYVQTNASSKPKVKIENPTSYLITMGTKTDNGSGGSISAVDGEDTPNTIVSGGYIKDDGSIVVTATPNTGYSFAGWYSDSDCTSELDDDEDETANTYTKTNLDAALSIYAKFTENMTTVTLATNNSHGHVTVGGDEVTETTAGVTTTRTITAVPDDGYYFSGWTVVAGSDFSVAGTGEANATTTLTGGGAGEGSGQTLKANFVELDKIYFRNIFDDGENEPTHWANVYVYFDVAWDTSHDPSWGVWYASDKVRTQMTQITGTNVYWAYVPRTFTSGNKTSVAFSEQAFAANLNFRTGNAAFRSDYNKLLNMFVPHHTKSSTQTYTSGSSYTTNYYSNGYWMKYDTRAGQGSGYYLKKYNSRNSYSLDSVFRATNDDATFIQCRIRVDGTTDENNRYMIVSAAGLNYIADSTITSLRNTKGVSEDTRTLADNDVYFQVKATSEGFYTFILDQSGDKMKLTVDYPVSPGDYRLKHTYTRSATTYTTYSDVIKANVAGSGDTVSMYLSTEGSETLVLQECTSINSSTKLPEWSAGYSDNLDGVLTKVGDKAGVYRFNITVNTSTDKVTKAEDIVLYDGPFYIKTDCAPGGWANYKQNILKENTVNASDYDYYMCKWIGNTTTNVKCVIANDYNNEISDTLKSDAILTRSKIEYQTLPEAGSVRFSYNSATNELKRTYLLGGTTQVKIEPLDDYVYGSSSGSDEYTTSTNFTDCGNWMYRLEAYVYPGAKAGVYTNYPTSNPTKEQLVPTTFTLMGGKSKGSTRYNVQLIYDFQTNELVSAYIANGEVSSAIDLNSNFLYVRNGTSASTQLSFTGSGKLTNVKHAYGVFEFPKNEMSGQMDSWTDNSYQAYKYCRYYFSFPFDVRVSDIFGVGEFGTHYIIQKYNGAKRAKVGWFMEYNTFWETVSITDTLNANEGYCLMLDRKAFNSTASDGVWTNISAGQSTYLYFPSMNGSLGTIDAASGTYDIDSLSCKINRSWTTASGTKNHMTTDSNWRMIGMPAYANAYSDGGTNPFESCYKYDPSDNSWKTYSVANKANPLQSMHAYMIQWAGKFDWTTTAPTSVAARQPQNTTNTLITLNLMKDGTARDWTYVKLQDGADSDFVLNEDMCKVVNGGIPNIYTYAGSYDAGYNKVPAVNQTIPVGVIIRKSGEYTFSMENDIAGTVTLIDSYTGTHTNLAINDYVVELEPGTINGRFYLEINGNKVPTAIDGAQNGEGTLKDGKAHKFIMNDQMYILRDGVIYDVQGRKVE